MLFSEIYSAYYNTVAAIIACSQKGKLDSDSLFEIVKNSAFPESVMTIGDALESGKWPLIKKDYSTNIKQSPSMPLSLLQKQWLKAILSDKRIRLFAGDDILIKLKQQLMDVEPLFSENDFYLYDKYSDGDPYDDENYVRIFRTVLEAVHGNKSLKVEYNGRLDRIKSFSCTPRKIEYSEKDDKFRIICNFRSRHYILNIARINRCEIIDRDEAGESKSSEDLNLELSDNRHNSVTLEIYDERKAMERVMLAFAHFEKSAVQIRDDVYRLTLRYDSYDETELVIRVLSFGPMVKVLEPENFKRQIQKRISKQLELMNQK